MASTTRRRHARSARAARGRFGLGVLLVSLILASTEASLFKRKRNKGVQQPGAGGKGGKGKGGKRGKVKEDVAWLLEDTSDGTWKPVKDDGHVQVWKRSMPNSDFVAIKSKASLAVSPQALFEVLTPGDIEIVRQYNPLVEDGSDLEVIDRDNKVSWSATMGVWPCRPRDFVTHIRRATLDDGSVAIVNSATTHPKAPVKSKYVRGEILHGVFHIKAAKNKKHSEFTMVHHFNPGGNIPPWLINWLAEGKPAAFVRKLEEVARKWDEQAALTKNMPCKGRGFADKPCAFLLAPPDGSQEADGSASGGPMAAGGGCPACLATLTMAALLCGGWLVCFGWPTPSEKTKLSPVAKAEGNGSKETKGAANGSPPGADAMYGSPAAHEPHEAPPPERVPSDRNEVRGEEMASEDGVGERDVGRTVGGEAQDAERPEVEASNGEMPGAQDSNAQECTFKKEPSGEVPGAQESNAEECSLKEPDGGVPNEEGVSGPAGGENVCGEGGGMPSSPPSPTGSPSTSLASAPVSPAAESETPDESGALGGPLPAAQGDPETVALGGERVSKDSSDGQAECVERNGGSVEDVGETRAPEPSHAAGAPDAGETESARNEDGEADHRAPRDVANGDVCDNNGCNGEDASLEVPSGKAASREFRENSLFLFGDKPFESSTG